MGRNKWVTFCGSQFMNHIFRVIICESHVMGNILYVKFCGLNCQDHIMGNKLWVTLCDLHFVVDDSRLCHLQK